MSNLAVDAVDGADQLAGVGGNLGRRVDEGLVLSVADKILVGRSVNAALLTST